MDKPHAQLRQGASQFAGFLVRQIATGFVLQHGEDASLLIAQIEVSTPEAIDKAVTAALENGGRLVRAAYDTYYNARQAIMEDPEGNVFRINHRKGPRIPADELENPPWELD